MPMISGRFRASVLNPWCVVQPRRKVRLEWLADADTTVYLMSPWPMCDKNVYLIGDYQNTDVWTFPK